MTKIALISDLHLPHWSRTQTNDHLEVLMKDCQDADIICNAGDSYEASDHLDSPNHLKLKYFPNKVYLEAMGNHDYYHGSFKNEFYTYEYTDGTKFFVGTLWTNFNDNKNDNDLGGTVCSRSINDFRLIQGGTVQNMKKAFNETIEALQDYKPDVVMTHFAPFHQCINYKKFGDTPINYFFCNNLRWILKKQPQIKLWMAGHTHEQHDFVIQSNNEPYENCRVVNHALGYWGENYWHFEDYKPKMIEI